MSESLAGVTLQTSAHEEEEDFAIVYAGDYVNKMSGQRIERECFQRMERGCRALVINFRDTELVNSIGVSILIGVIDAAEARGMRVAFTNLSPHTVKLFELLGLTRLVVLADSEEAALATLKEFAPIPPGH
jgi:anti-anti-sigma factor